MAYDWKSKISNTGMLRFCSNVPTTPDKQKNESSVLKKSLVIQKDSLDTVASGKDDDVKVSETIISATTESEGSESKRLMPPLEESKLCSSGFATKRTSSQAGLLSPREKHPSPSSKNQKKCSTPNNQRMISDFFKKWLYFSTSERQSIRCSCIDSPSTYSQPGKNTLSSVSLHKIIWIFKNMSFTHVS